jgi:predicted small lipoprotein YifL
MRFERRLLLGLAACAILGCGQKGPLFLPDKAGEVVTRPGPLPSASTPDASSAPSPADQPVPAPAPDEPVSKAKDAKPK